MWGARYWGNEHERKYEKDKRALHCTALPVLLNRSTLSGLRLHLPLRPLSVGHSGDHHRERKETERLMQGAQC